MKRTPEQREEASRRQKEHVALVRWVANVTELPFSQVANNWSRLKEEGLLQGDLVAIKARIDELEGNLNPDKGEERFKIMLWAINKCNGVEAARAAFDLAADAWTRTRDLR